MEDFTREQFQRIFQSGDAQRAKFLSRVFGVFSEEIVKLWTSECRAPYKNLGRPTLREVGGTRRHTLDFTLEDRRSGEVFVAEMKCEIEYQNFRYFTLESNNQLGHHKKPAFEAFLQVAKSPGAWKISTKKEPEISIKGAILIWGDATLEGKEQVKRCRGFHDVLTIAEICRDLQSWKCEKFRGLIKDRQRWCDEMFSALGAISD